MRTATPGFLSATGSSLCFLTSLLGLRPLKSTVRFPIFLILASSILLLSFSF